MKRNFDIEAAKAGAKVVTRDGRPVRILCYDNTDHNYPIVAVVYDKDADSIYDYTAYTANGKYMIDSGDNGYDLFIEEEPKYRPYANPEELLNDMKKHGNMVRNNVSCEYYAINQISKQDVSVCSYRFAFPFTEFQTKFTWLDGTPCGVQEGGGDV